MEISVKRSLDVLLSGIALIVLAPILFAVGIMVSMESPGGPLFRQVRVGRERKRFRINKFRTMTVRADADLGSFDAGDEQRVTRIGAFLRATKIDELPQLWNVLVGEMSLVGPRPEVPKWTEIHRERWDRILADRPGLVDEASLEFRHEQLLLAASDDPEALYRDVILPRKLELSEAYARERTFLIDLRLILKTLWTLARRATGSSAPDAGQSRP